MGTSKTSSLCSWMSERSRSSGPSNWGSATAKGACGRGCTVCCSTRILLLDPHGGTNLLHRLPGHHPRLLGAEPDQLVHPSGMAIELGAGGAVLLERGKERLEEHLLAIDAADPGAAATHLHLLDARLRAVGAVQMVDGADF